METYLADHEWLADAFSIADIIMAGVLWLADRFEGHSYTASQPPTAAGS